METVTKQSDTTFKVEKAVTAQDVVVYNINDLLKEKAGIESELARVNDLIAKAKTAGVEPVAAEVAEEVK